MNAIQPIRPIVGAFAHKLTTTLIFRAYRLSGDKARELDIGAPRDLAEAIANATAHFLAHKDTLLIHETDEARRVGTLHSFTIRKKAATYVRDPLTGLSQRVEPLYADKLFSLPVDAFEPTRAFDAFRDDAVGVDRTLVSQGTGR